MTRDEDDKPLHYTHYTGGAYREAKKKLTGSIHGQVNSRSSVYKSTRRKVEKDFKKEALKRKMK